MAEKAPSRLTEAILEMATDQHELDEGTGIDPHELGIPTEAW